MHLPVLVEHYLNKWTDKMLMMPETFMIINVIFVLA